MFSLSLLIISPALSVYLFERDKLKVPIGLVFGMLKTTGKCKGFYSWNGASKPRFCNETFECQFQTTVTS